MSATDHQTEYSDGTGPSRGNGETLRNGVVGGIVAVVLAVLPLSALLGGATAGYLDRKAGRSGSVAGAVAGVVAAVPYLLAGVYLSINEVSVPAPELGVPVALLVAGATVFMVSYALGLSILGGFVGSCVYDRWAT